MKKIESIFNQRITKEPYWTNPKNGLEWHIEKIGTDWCTRYAGGLPILDAVCFSVVKNKGRERDIISFVLLEKETNSILAEKESIPNMCSYIDFLRLSIGD